MIRAIIMARSKLSIFFMFVHLVHFVGTAVTYKTRAECLFFPDLEIFLKFL